MTVIKDSVIMKAENKIIVFTLLVIAIKIKNEETITINTVEVEGSIIEVVIIYDIQKVV